jgi:hypothetical protein
MDQEKINFRQARDFGQTFNVSVMFIRQNFKLFFLSIALIAGPFAVISAIAGSFYQASVLGMEPMRIGQNPIDFLMAQFGFVYFLFLLLSVITAIAMTVTAYSFMITYQEKGTGQFTVGDVAKTVSKNIGNALLVFIVFSLLIILAIIIIALIFVALNSISWILAVLVGFFCCSWFVSGSSAIVVAAFCCLSC